MLAPTEIRLILGDQLNPYHSWFKHKNGRVLYVVAEILEEASYVPHHIQKVCGFFIAMENFAAALQLAGHHVLHLTLNQTQQHPVFLADKYWAGGSS